MKKMIQSLAALTLLGVADIAIAHPGHTSGNFSSGLTHPLSGLDHLLAMLAIGFWSARQGHPLKSFTPALAIAGMMLGAAVAWGGLTVPGVETGIGLTLLITGLLISTMTRLNLTGAPVIALFMSFHGYAHAMEMPSGSLLLYIAGFSLTTFGLVLAGRSLGQLAQQIDDLVTRYTGGALMVTGVSLLSL